MGAGATIWVAPRSVTKNVVFIALILLRLLAQSVATIGNHEPIGTSRCVPSFEKGRASKFQLPSRRLFMAILDDCLAIAMSVEPAGRHWSFPTVPLALRLQSGHVNCWAGREPFPGRVFRCREWALGGTSTCSFWFIVKQGLKWLIAFLCYGS